MMIVPLPTWLLDILISTNLSLSMAILLVVLYVPDVLAIATFPTVLLLTTLFRLALNVSSSRLILLQANAGEVIRAFGNFVVRGNYVVGGVVFLILTILQFVVIAKGGEPESRWPSTPRSRDPSTATKRAGADVPSRERASSTAR